MINFSSCFETNRKREEKQIRHRILNEFRSNSFIMSVNTPKSTFIDIVEESGEYENIYKFDGYLDLVSASLSSDKELLHYVERIPSRSGNFSFSSRIVHIKTGKSTKQIKEDQPIYAIFIQKQPNSLYYHLLHFIGSKVSHITCKLGNTILETTFVRGGINIPSLIAYTYKRETENFIAVYSDGKSIKLCDFKFKLLNRNENSIVSKAPIPISIENNCLLPPELAANSLSQLNLPYFTQQKTRFFFSKFNNQYTIVYQIYKEEYESLTFVVSCFPIGFKQIVTIPGVPSDYLFSFVDLKTLIIIFAPNTFICLIDTNSNTQNMIRVINLDKKFIATNNCVKQLRKDSILLSDHNDMQKEEKKINNLCINAPIPNCIIDIENGNCFQLYFDFSCVSFDLFQTKPYLYSLLCSRLNNPLFIKQFLINIQKTDNQFLVLSFLQNMIHNFVFIDRKPNLLAFDLSTSRSKNSKKSTDDQSTNIIQMPKSQSYFQLKNEQDLDNKKMQSISKITVHHHSSVYDLFSQKKQNSLNPQNQLNQIQSTHNQQNTLKGAQTKPSASLQIKDLLNEMEQEFPSSGMKNRTDLFREIFLSYIHQKSFSYTQEQSAKIAIKFLNKQNEISLILRNALDMFLKTDESKSDQIYSLVSQICIESETYFESLPSVACLKAELSIQAQDVLSSTMLKTLGYNRIISNNYNEKESKHWMKRIPAYLLSSKKNCTCINGSSLSSASDLSFRSDNKSLSAVVIMRNPVRTRSFNQLHPLLGSDSN